MAEKVVTEQLVAAAGGMASAAAGVALNVANEANNRIVNNLCDKRHRAKTQYIQQKNDIDNKLSGLRATKSENQKSLDAVKAKIIEEEKAMSTFENVKNDASIKFIVGLGSTGHGKSTVLNRLYGDTSRYGNKGPFEASDSDQSVTLKPNHKEREISNVQSVVVDTPGYNDSKNRDNLHFNNMESYLYGCGGVDAFLLVMNGTLNRFDGNIQLMMTEYAKYFGSTFWNHLIVILTRIEGFEKEKYLDQNKGQTLQKNLKDEFKLSDDNNIPIITVGYGDNYAEFSKTVMNEVIKISDKNAKLACDAIKSPIKQLKEQKGDCETKKAQLNAAITPKEAKING